MLLSRPLLLVGPLALTAIGHHEEMPFRSATAPPSGPSMFTKQGENPPSATTFPELSLSTIPRGGHSRVLFKTAMKAWGCLLGFGNGLCPIHAHQASVSSCFGPGVTPSSFCVPHAAGGSGYDIGALYSNPLTCYLCSVASDLSDGQLFHQSPGNDGNTSLPKEADDVCCRVTQRPATTCTELRHRRPGPACPLHCSPAWRRSPLSQPTLPQALPHLCENRCLDRKQVFMPIIY